MLAILQVGEVVVPLGVSHPLTRTEVILRDTAARIVLVDDGQASRLAGLAKPSSQLLTIDATFLASLLVREAAPTTEVTAENAAWVIFTSGSTGVPKGILLSHKSLSTSVQAHGAVFETGPQTRAAQFAAYTFDVSIPDIFSTLHHGSCVCVFSEESRMNDLTGALKAYEVNYVNLTPTVVRLLDPTNLPLIKTLVAGGEPLDAEIVRRWSNHAAVFNSYGPSECAIISACYAPTDPDKASAVGFLTGTRLWVTQMTDYNQLCPIGVAGELLIDGPMLARGYLNDDKKTAAAFIENPAFLKNLKVEHGNRFYRTWDLVRQNKDGSLTHLGRRDTQVKIRGQRVEIGEIETCIAQNLKTARSVMVLITDQGHRKQQTGLVAILELYDDSVYYRTSAKGKSEASFLPPTSNLRKAFDQLRKTLFEILPAYMVPNLFLPISEMPLNPSGKLDRRATRTLLEAIDPEQTQRYLSIEQKVAASTGTERVLQKLWADVLGLDAGLVEVHDHFFQIGGDYVEAIRTVASARERHQLHMTVADILQLQEGLIAITSRQPTAYVYRRIFSLDDTIDVDRFKATWQTIAGSTSILRTRILFGQRIDSIQVVVREQLHWHQGKSLEAYLEGDRAASMTHGQRLDRFGLIEALSEGRFFV